MFSISTAFLPLGSIESFSLYAAGVAPQTPIERKTAMKKVNWLIEQNIYDRESEFLAELQKQGYIYKQTKYLNFRPEAAHQYFPLMIVFYSGEP